MAAAVFIPPSPQIFGNMSSRRAPLASVPNATNSPFRSLGAGQVAATKRPRPLSNVQQENVGGQPPLKRQMVERDETGPRTPRQRIPPATADGRVFEKSAVVNPVAFERRLVAARDKGPNVRPSRSERIAIDNAETVRQWQKHYRKVFPTFVFYFESVSEEIRNRCTKQVMSMGARVEKFFSRAVTHVVTTRIPPIATESSVTSDGTGTTSSTSTDVLHNIDGQPRTINPSLLEKLTEPTAPPGSLANFKFPFETAPVRKSQAEQFISRKEPTQNMDILARALQMNMKIWQLEKLQRILSAILDTDGTAEHRHNTRSNTNTLGEANLSQVLRNEKLNGPSDRDPSAVSKELVPFKGPFIYIHDAEEKYKPTMVREYPKVEKRQDGAWPQFRSSAQGKCPFLDEPVTKKDIEREEARERAIILQREKEREAARKTRSTTLQQEANMEPPGAGVDRMALREVENGSNHAVAPEKQAIKSNPSPMGKPQPAPFGFMRPSQMHMAREPAASGVQPSNLTSAIRSQMVSSTAAAPGAKAGTSKEVHELKRKVLERNSGSFSVGSVGSIPSSHRMNDLAGALKQARAPAARAAKSKAQEKLGQINEETAGHSDDENGGRRKALSRTNAPQKKKAARKDPKPGYCENCRDKFEDFEEHTYSRKHRKFAVTQSNWAELDALLVVLQRPGRPVQEELD